MKRVSVIGAGSFGTTIANLLAENHQVTLYCRRESVKNDIITNRQNGDKTVHEGIIPTTDLAEALEPTLVFIVIPSASMRSFLQSSTHLFSPRHIVIHGTKGFDFSADLLEKTSMFSSEVKTMSAVIQEETAVLRVGCLAGPNLAKEIAQGQPAAAVVASRFEEVIDSGKSALRSSRFQVFGSRDIIGAELAGALKNCIAIASGILTGLGLGENAKAMLISKGLGEITQIGMAMGSNRNAFFGLPGIGDLVATCSSPLSRNFSVGQKLAKGLNLDAIVNEMDEVAEGVRTTQVAKRLGDLHQLPTPIITTLHKVLFDQLTVQEGLDRLMQHDFGRDVNFI